MQWPAILAGFDFGGRFLSRLVRIVNPHLGVSAQRAVDRPDAFQHEPSQLDRRYITVGDARSQLVYRSPRPVAVHLRHLQLSLRDPAA